MNAAILSTLLNVGVLVVVFLAGYGTRSYISYRRRHH